MAEHIYGVQMLAIAMWSEYDYDIDLFKALSMIAVHELEEVLIGDLTMFEIEKQDKVKLGHQAVEQILDGLMKGQEIRNLVFEFDERKTKEAKFAYQCDKLECDIQCKLYDEQNCVDLKNLTKNSAIEHELVKPYLEKGMAWSQMWLTFGQDKNGYDENFKKVSNYALNNKILE